MGFCKNCSANCLNIVPDACVEYTGAPVPSLGIDTGMALCDVLAIVFEKLGTASPVPGSSLIKGADVVTSARKFTESKALSIYSAPLKRSYSYELTQKDDGVNFAYDLRDVVKSLPNGYVADYVKVVASGASTTSTGTVITQSDKDLSGFKIPYKSLPAKVEMEVRVKTPGGTVDLTKIVNVASNLQTGKFSGNMSVVDMTTIDDEVTQDTYNEIVSAEIVDLKEKYESFNKLDVAQPKNISFPSQDLVQVVQTIANETSSLVEKVNEDVKVTYNKKEENLQDVVDTMQSTIDSLKSQNESLSNQITLLKSSLTSAGIKV